MVTTVLDHAGPLRLWDVEPTAETPRAGMAVRISFCTTPDCRAAHLDVKNLRDRASGGPGEPPSGGFERGPRHAVTVNVDTGAMRLDEDRTEGPPDEDLLERLEQRVLEPGGLLPMLQKRWRHVRGVTRDAWQEADWSSWEPGSLVSWVEVYPDAPNLLFASRGETLWANDHYCITAGCSCRQVLLEFRGTRNGVSTPIASVRVDLDRWTLADPDGGAPTDLQARLWADLDADADHVRQDLRRRRKELRRLGPRIRALAGRGAAPVPRSDEAPGRNDPCPCGSGRKYKKCCMP